MGRPRKYATEEERKAAKRAYKKEYMAKYYQEHRDEILKKQTKYNQKHKDAHAEYYTKWYQVHKKEKAEYQAKYHREHRTEKAEYNANYRQTKEGRACYLINTYKRNDKKYNRGDCDLTVPWFVRNIFTKCIYCGESDWEKLGCDRIDNSLPHTIENVVPCCAECNAKRHMKPFEQFYWEMKHETLGEES